MAWTEPSDVDTLAAECERVSEVVLALAEDEFDAATRCPPWDVKALLGHMYRDVDRIVQYRDVPAGAPDATAVSYWRSYDPVADAPDIAARAQEVANGFGSGTDLARAFDRRWREAAAAARALPPDRSIRTFGPTLRLEEYVRTRVLEIAVHGLDLADALGRAPWMTPGAAHVVRRILVGLLGGDPPAPLGWDDVTFIETGTGRRRPTSSELEALGERAALLPLLA